MISRFFQLVLLAGLILLIPSFLYLSHPATPTLVDPATGLAYSADSMLRGHEGNALAQVSQGNGVEPAHAWNGWSWHDASANVNKGVHHVEDRVKGLIDHWRPTGAPASDTTTAAPDPKTKPASAKPAAANKTVDAERVPGVIMPKMANATAKAALGRSTWHFLHTMTLRFPDHPTAQESATLRTFFENFSQLYPCGECAHHFQQLIKDLPPQVGSRKGASLWLCALHNEVNKSLGKDEFPCDKLDESYDCGCGDEPGKDAKGKEGDKGKEVAPKTEVTPLA
ncbi:related to ERV2-Flavin dependent sulfhydryl oxidase [Sporisorium reilianum SRZ2]|uniref:Sulfhydryl oxidase n=1 Tax=Sporisorium reilianum (strain SRZ2) TaxID=999809 RepID=E6ZXS1_SPORE|nr:related to ERV2-Flavin dependent sulfhydryl oxidase [Sporisorium reilianum SRZ2]